MLQQLLIGSVLLVLPIPFKPRKIKVPAQLNVRVPLDLTLAMKEAQLVIELVHHATSFLNTNQRPINRLA